MKKPFLLAALLSGAMLMHAGTPQAGMVISENSVPCGTKVEKGKKNRQITTDALCQEYVVRTTAVD